MVVLKSDAWHKVCLVRPGLWQIVFHYPSSTNCWLWEEEDGLTLVDAGYPQAAGAILAAVQAIGRPLRSIVITHAHPDHAGGAAEISAKTGAQVLAHADEIPYLKGESMSDLPGFWLCKAVLSLGKQVGVLSPPVVQNVASLVDGERVGRLQVVHTPGHTPGSLSLWSDEDGSLFCGDNICSTHFLHVGLPWFTLDLATQRTALQRYNAFPATMLLPGHGPVYRGDVANKIRRLTAGNIQPA